MAQPGAVLQVADGQLADGVVAVVDVQVDRAAGAAGDEGGHASPATARPWGPGSAGAPAHHQHGPRRGRSRRPARSRRSGSGLSTVAASLMAAIAAATGSAASRTVIETGCGGVSQAASTLAHQKAEVSPKGQLAAGAGAADPPGQLVDGT